MKTRTKHIVHIYGGLGNQMFQYAFFEHLKNKKLDTYINTDCFKNNKEKEKHVQNFLLTETFLNINTTPVSDLISRVFYSNRYWWKFFRILRKITFQRSKTLNAFNIINKSNINKEMKQSKFHYRDYWDEMSYIEEIEDIIKDAFVFNTINLEEKNKECLKNIKNTNAVSIHVRRGDYLILSEHFGGICTEQYYNKAISLIKKKVANPYFYIFSNDIDWCKTFFINLKDKTFIDWNTEKNSYLDMFLMSNCNHNIIANSTFSWWGAFLNPHQNKLVVLPKQMTNKKTSNKLLFEGCIQI